MPSWDHLKELFDEVVDLSPDERAVYLDKLCGDDAALRAELQTLLDADEQAKSFMKVPAVKAQGGTVIDHPAWQVAPSLIEDSTGTLLMAGEQIGPYKIEGSLGAGGMGKVYKARDTRLSRWVAIKVLNPEFRGRFEREARAISSLNHPNICTLYDVGPNYLVMELVEGETLAARLRNGPLATEMALRCAAQITAGLREAHENGIIHRDLKPGNIMLTKSGIKVLDFGLAKSERDDTLTTSHMVMGTPAYMAPEQREGKPADARSDIYSFGCVLYEMLVGARAGYQRGRIPSRKLERIVNRCLEEDPALRWQSVAEVERELVGVTATGNRGKRMLAATAVMLALFAGPYLYFHHARRLTDKDTIVLADFVNKTGDSIFDGTLRQGLAIQLEQSPFLNLLSDIRIKQTLALMVQPEDARVTPDLARQVCQRTGSAATIEGSIASLGRQYVVGLKAVNCRSGDTLGEEQMTAYGKEQVLKVLGDVSTKLRAKLGESLVSVEKNDAPLENVTTPSLEALQAYTLGYQAQVIKDDWSSAIPFFQRATRLDPNFAMAWARLGTIFGNLGETASAAESMRKAYQLGGRVSERERFYIGSHYELDVTGDLEAARRIYEMWAQTYKRDFTPLDNLCRIYSIFGEYNKALAAAQEAFKLNPGSANGYTNLIGSYMHLNRLDDARAAAQDARAHNAVSPLCQLILYMVDFLRHDFAGMEHDVSELISKPTFEDQMLYLESETATYVGQFVKARVLTRRATDLAKRASETEQAAGYEAEAGLREVLVGNTIQARRYVQAALAFSNGREVQAISALTLGLAGDSSAMRLARNLARRFPTDTIVQLKYLPIIRAAILIGRRSASKEAAKAIEILANAVPYEIGTDAANMGLYPVYLRAEVYLATKQSRAAAAEFQKILDHSGVIANDCIGVLARLGLGRAYAVAGDNAKARAAYQDFLTIWKDADPDLPILKEAKAEFAKL